MSAAALWDPAHDAVHRLIQHLDVLAVALNRFRQLSFRLPPVGDPRFAAARQGLFDDFSAVKRAAFPPEDVAPQHTAARLADAAVAALARAGSGDEGAVRAAEQWLAAVWCVVVPRAYPGDPGSPLHDAFDREGDLLGRYTQVRRGLVVALARAKRSIPDQIIRRQSLASCSLAGDGEQPVPQEVLLEWIAATRRGPGDGAVVAPVPDPASPSTPTRPVRGRTESAHGSHLERAEAEYAAAQARGREQLHGRRSRHETQSLVEVGYGGVLSRWRDWVTRDRAGADQKDTFDGLLSEFSSVLTELGGRLRGTRYEGRWRQADHDRNFRRYKFAEYGHALTPNDSEPLSRARYDAAVSVVDAVLDGRFLPEMLRPLMGRESLRGTLSYLGILLRGLVETQALELRRGAPALPVTTRCDIVEPSLNPAASPAESDEASEHGAGGNIPTGGAPVLPAARQTDPRGHESLLSETAWAMVDQLQHDKAFSERSRITLAALAGKIGGSRTAEDLKRYSRELRKAGFLKSRQGRVGGVWLTPRGRELREPGE